MMCLLLLGLVPLVLSRSPASHPRETVALRHGDNPMDPADYSALLQLAVAQPAAVRAGCFAGWQPGAGNPCGWRGVTCETTALRKLLVLDLRHCGVRTWSLTMPPYPPVSPLLADSQHHHVQQLSVAHPFSFSLPLSLSHSLPACKVVSLPAKALAAWGHLEVLDLRGNAITALPPTIQSLTSLQRIMVEMNQLQELPDEICALRNLTNLYAAYNDFDII